MRYVGAENVGDSEAIMNVPAFFHAMLFAYQKTTRQILGSGENVLLHPMLTTLELVYNKQGLDLTKGETLDEVFQNFAKELEKTGFVESASFKKLGKEKYMFNVNGCTFAKGVHDLLKPKDVSCPFATVAKTIFQKVTNKKVLPTDSKFTATGQQTIIEPVISK